MTFSSSSLSPKSRGWLIAVAAALLMTVAACEPRATSVSSATAPIAVDADAQAVAQPSPDADSVGADPRVPPANDPDLGGAIRQGMSYGELSKAMSEHGWQPVSGDACLVNMVGADHAAKCAANPNSQSCAWCRELPALQQCSADGRCLLRFTNASSGQVLEVGMDGELDLWKHNAPETMFGVSGWRYPSSEGP